MEIPIIQNKHLFEWFDTFTICSDWESGLQNNFSLRYRQPANGILKP